MPYLSFDLSTRDVARLRRLARRRRRSVAQQAAALLELALAFGLDDPEAAADHDRSPLPDLAASLGVPEPVHAQ